MASARPSMLTVIARRWRTIARNAVIATLIVAGLSLLVHNKFTASAMLLPPDTNSDLMSMLSNVPGAMALSRLAGVDVSTGTNMYIGVMRSGRVTGHLINRFHLVKHYDEKDSEKATKQLASNTSIEITEEGMIRVAVSDRDPALAADLANAYVAELDAFLRASGAATAGNRRAFMERRITAEKTELTATEDSLRDYQIRERMPALGTDAMKSAGVAADLLGRRAALEVELGTLDKVARLPSGRAEELRMQLGEIDAQIVRIPPATTNIGRLFRSVKTHEAVLLVLTQEYEHAKLQELKDFSSVEILDRAAPPLHKSSPHRTLIVLAGFLAAFAAGSVLAWAREGIAPLA